LIRVLSIRKVVFPCARRNRKGKREYLNNLQTRDLMKQLNQYFDSSVEIPRIRIGKRQTLDTLISEEALLFAKFLRNERKEWKPRIPTINVHLKHAHAHYPV